MSRNIFVMLQRFTPVFLFLFGFCFFAQSQTINTTDEDYVLNAYERNFDSLLTNFFHNKTISYQNRSFSNSTRGNFISATSVPDSVFIKRLESIPTLVPMSYNDKVRNYIEFYVDRYQKSINVMLSLSKYYFPIFEEVLDQAGVPLELKYLSIVESALNPQAVSRAGATGLWQFMYATGKQYDLRINSLVDERRDPIKSSVAAANYLSDLYKIYKDWTLAIAAYNCGPGNINKAIRRAGGKTNYWEIYDYLPAETRGYIPAYIAATYVMNYYKEHGIYPSKIDFPVLTDTVLIRDDVHLGQISEVLNVSIEELRSLNPQYKSDIIPGKSDMYSLKLPINIVPQFITLQDSIVSYKSDVFFQPILTSKSLTENNGTEKLYYKVRKNDTWVKIASSYGVNATDLKKWNKQTKKKRPTAGKNLVIYRYNPLLASQNSEKEGNEKTIQETTTEEKPVIKPTSQPKVSTQTNYYKVRKGDTLFSIAQKYDTTVDSLRKMNKLTAKATIKPGQRLRVL